MDKDGEVYHRLCSARSYLRRLDDFWVRAAEANGITFEHYNVLLTIFCLNGKNLPVRVLAEHLVRDRTATAQLCRRMEQIGLLKLAYEPDSGRPQLLVSLSDQGREIMEAVTKAALQQREEYVFGLPENKRESIAEAVRFSWLYGLESKDVA